MTATRASWWGLSLAISLAGVLPGRAAPDWVERLTVWATPELRDIDARQLVIEEELAGLPAPAGTNSGIRRGFQTGRVKEGEDLWVELALVEPGPADCVVLVPLLAKGAKGQVPGYGFPRRFQLEATDEDGEVYMLLDKTGDDLPNPGLYPVSAKCPAEMRIKRIRLTATEPWQQGGPPVLALAEMLVLRGNSNLTMGATVTASSSRELAPTWSRRNLIDLATPLGLPVAPGRTGKSGWHSEISTKNDAVKSVTIDLGKIHQVKEIRLAPVWRRAMPTWYHYGFPALFLVESSTTEDFSDVKLVSDQTRESFQPPGQNLQWFEGRIPRPMRFIRVTAKRLRQSTGDYIFALGELQVYAGGENVALGAQVIAEESLEDDEWGRDALTDGLAAGGTLLELPDWFDGLERRRVLEQQSETLRNRRGKLLARGEHVLVTGSIGATVGIAALTALLSLRNRRQRKIDRERHRERLARDLHDELGSNLGSIALISSFAKDGENDPEQMRHDLAEIEQVARESADSMRDMVEMLGGGQGGAASDWLSVMEGLAQRLLRGVELDCRLPDGPLVLEPDLETRREIYLFCKEVLHNVARHASANTVHFHLRSQSTGLQIEIADDGCGFDPAAANDGHGLGNLRERAAGLNATMNLVSSPGEETVVTLDVPRGRRWRKPAASMKQ